MSYQNLSYGGYSASGGMSGYPGGQAGYPGGQPGSGYPGGQPGSGYPGGQPGSGYSGPQPGSGYQGHQFQQGGQMTGSGMYPGVSPGVSPDIQQWFNAVDSDRSGRITSSELQAALVNGHGKNFSDTACKLMIGMFDHDKSGTIDVQEFQMLYNYINQWLATFRSYDKDGSGNIEEPELSQALQQMGFRFSPEFVKYLINKNDPRNHQYMSVDQFIVTCVQIQRFTEAFRVRDKEMKGVVTISFEDFLSVALSCNV